MQKRAFIFGVFVVVVSLSLACAPQVGKNRGGSASAERPELTEDTIRERLMFARVFDIPEETGAGETISWGFYSDEPKEITVVERVDDGDRSTIVLDIKTRSSARAREPKSLSGQVRTYWELETGWVLRKWRIVNTENISMKYKKLPKPPEQNSNRPPA
jgi:hypothetical protein